MQMEKSMTVHLSDTDLAEAVRVYLTTPRIRRKHKLPVADGDCVDVDFPIESTDALRATATITIPAK